MLCVVVAFASFAQSGDVPNAVFFRYRAVVESERQLQAASTSSIARLNLASDELSRARALVLEAKRLIPTVVRVQAQTFTSPQRATHGHFSEHDEWKWGGRLEKPDGDRKVPEVLVWAISRAEELIKQSHDSLAPWRTAKAEMYVCAMMLAFEPLGHHDSATLICMYVSW